MINNLTYLKGFVAIVCASFLWGTTGTAASYSPDISPLGIGAFAMGVGGILLVITAWEKLVTDYRQLVNQPKTVMFGAVSVAVYPLAFYSSMRLSGVAIGTVVSIATAPFFAALLERIVSKKQFSKQWILSFVIGAVGIALLVAGRDYSHVDIGFDNQLNIGVLLGCVAGLAYASYSWAARRLIEKGVDSQASMSALFGCAAVLLLPSLWLTGNNLFSSVTNISVAFYMAIVPMYLGYVLFGLGLSVIDASQATLITLIEPLVATILAVVIVKESFALIGWLGAGLVSVCLILQAYTVERTKA